MANPFPFTAGQVLTAAQLNSIGEAWTSYTPVLKGGATTVTATINYAKYAQINKIVIATAQVTATAAGAANGIVSLSLPIAPASSLANMRVTGTFMILDSGVGFYIGAATIVPASSIVQGQAYNSADFMGTNTPALTLANNDVVAFTVIYEVA